MEMEAVTSANSKATELYEMGKLKGELGDFQASIAKLEEAALIYQKARDHKKFIKCLTLCLRMYAELEDQKALEALKVRLYDYVTREKN